MNKIVVIAILLTMWSWYAPQNNIVEIADSRFRSSVSAVTEYSSHVIKDVHFQKEFASEIEFVYTETEPIVPMRLKILDIKKVVSVIATIQTSAPEIRQGFYRMKDEASMRRIYSYVEIRGKKYDLGQVAYGEFGDDTAKRCEFSFFGSKLDASGAVFYVLHKSYGAKYVATAFYTLSNAIPEFICEILGVSSYYNYDNDDDAIEILSTDFAVFAEWKISKIDLKGRSLRSASLNTLLNCDVVHTQYGAVNMLDLIFTYDIPAKSSTIDFLEDGGIYALDAENGVFNLRYVPTTVKSSRSLQAMSTS
jgi:hypothetical protein